MEWKTPFDELELVPHTDQRGTLFEVLRFEDFNIPVIRKFIGRIGHTQLLPLIDVCRTLKTEEQDRQHFG